MFADGVLHPASMNIPVAIEVASAIVVIAVAMRFFMLFPFMITDSVARLHYFQCFFRFSSLIRRLFVSASAAPSMESCSDTSSIM